MENFKLVCNREGHLHFNNEPTGIWLERMARGLWRLKWIGAQKSYAMFSGKGRVLTAAHVFIEGVTRKPDESARSAAIRALISCAETGSTSQMTS